MVCMDAGSLLASGREAGPVCNVGTNFMSTKSNPVLFPYHIALYDLWDETNSWPCSSTTHSPPGHIQARSKALAMPRIPLMRADSTPLAHFRVQQPGRFFRLPEISIQRTSCILDCHLAR